MVTSRRRGRSTQRTVRRRRLIEIGCPEVEVVSEGGHPAATGPGTSRPPEERGEGHVSPSNTGAAASGFHDNMDGRRPLPLTTHPSTMTAPVPASTPVHTLTAPADLTNIADQTLRWCASVLLASVSPHDGPEPSQHHNGLTKRPDLSHGLFSTTGTCAQSGQNHSPRTHALVRKPLPHPRGDHPYLAERAAAEASPAPPTWGSPGTGGADQEQPDPCPTHVGITRKPPRRAPQRRTLPHTRGDHPTSGFVGAPISCPAPPTWGSPEPCYEFVGQLHPCPTHVGSTLGRRCIATRTHPLPHARGDRPTIGSRHADAQPLPRSSWGLLVHPA